MKTSGISRLFVGTAVALILLVLGALFALANGISTRGERDIADRVTRLFEAACATPQTTGAHIQFPFALVDGFTGSYLLYGQGNYRWVDRLQEALPADLARGHFEISFAHVAEAGASASAVFTLRRKHAREGQGREISGCALLVRAAHQEWRVVALSIGEHTMIEPTAD